MKVGIPLLVATCAGFALLCTILLWALPAGATDGGATAATIDARIVMWGTLAAAAATGASSVAAAYAVAKIGSAAVGAIVEKPDLFGRMVVLVGLAEGIAIYGLIVSILIINRIG